MKCKCSLRNKFQTIGLCDLEKYNEEIIKFRDKSYSQVNLSEEIVLPNNFPDIKEIQKTYVNLDIDYSEIVETPVSKVPNNEGFMLTGKMLLVNGKIHQTIIYVTDDCYKSRHSLKISLNFTSYIVLDKNVNKNSENLFIYPYIENISLIPLSCRKIVENVSLFLFVNNNKLSPPVPPIPPEPPIPIEVEKLPNAFIFKTFDTDEEMARVEFDKTNKKLIVLSTGEVYNNGNDSVFSFELINALSGDLKDDGAIQGNQNAQGFKNDLNNKQFEYGDIINLNFDDKDKVVLIDLKNNANQYNMIANFMQSFKITEKGVIPYVISSDIILKNRNNEPVVKVQFDILNKLILAQSFEKLTNPGGSNYFKMSLLEEDLKTLKVTSNIPGNTTGEKFKDIFLGQIFKNTDVIRLEYEENAMVEITNYPTLATPIYNPKGRQELLQIDESSLEPLSLNIPEEIVIKSVDNKDVVYINFSKATNKIVASSTGVIADPSSPDDYFTLILKDKFGATKSRINLSSNAEPEDFEFGLNNTRFLFDEDRLILIYKNRSKIKILNYPSMGEVYTPDLDSSIFTISKMGLVDASFDNKIIIFNNNDEEMASLQFIETERNPITLVTSNKVKATDTKFSSKTYVEFLSYSLNELKNYVKITQQDDAGFFKEKVNDKAIILNSDILRLSNIILDRILITNFRDKARYTIGEEPVFFNLTKTSLVQHDLNYNKIRFKNKDDSTIAYVFFDNISSKNIYAEAYSTENINMDSDFFELKILDSREIKTKFLIRASKNDEIHFINVGESLFNISKEIVFGDILQITCSDSSLVEISDDPKSNKTMQIPSNTQRYLIDVDGLKPLGPKPQEKLPNAFIFTSIVTDEEVARVEFDKLSMKLIVTSTGNYYDESSDEIAFRFELLDGKQAGLIAEGRIREDETAERFRNELNDAIFEFNSLIILSYLDGTTVTLTNYPNQGDSYNMINNSRETFVITPNGIVQNVLPNEIILNDISNNPVFNMKFDKSSKQFLVKSTQNVANPTGGDDYFKATLTSKSGSIQKITSNIPGGQNARAFALAFNSEPFQFTDILTLEYEEGNKVVVTNYPDSSTPIYNPSGNKQSFIITIMGFQTNKDELEPPSPEEPIFLTNTILFKNLNNDIMATIDFDIVNKKLSVTSSGENYGGFDSSPALALSINGVVFSILNDENADAFKDYYNNKTFDFNDELVLQYLQNDRVEITNFPDLYTPVYNPKSPNLEAFLITEDGLVSNK